jgi:glucose/mannose-6-phosphate isomerase
MNIEELKKYDTKNVFGSIDLFSEQCKGAWENTKYVASDVKIKNILVIGMGGSALGAHIIESLDILTVPIAVCHDYNIPEWVNEETLVLAMSYSGGTEETISGTEEAINCGANIVGITVGGKLEEILKDRNIPVCILDTKENPCGQPRFGVGMMLVTMLKIFLAHDICKLSEKEIEDGIEELKDWQNKNKEIALAKIYERVKLLKDKIIVLIYAEHLTNVGRFVRNQIHETAKTLALAHEIPELNHHLMEGLKFPESNKKNLHFIFLESDIYNDKIKKRYEVTKDVLGKQGMENESVKIDGGTPFAQILIAMQRGMYFAFILSFVHQKDPSEIPWVNYFKKEMGK